MEVHLLWMLLIVVALASYLNYRYLRLPPMIGLMSSRSCYPAW
jgi:hypothetical protein